MHWAFVLWLTCAQVILPAVGHSHAEAHQHESDALSPRHCGSGGFHVHLDDTQHHQGHSHSHDDKDDNQRPRSPRDSDENVVYLSIAEWEALTPAASSELISFDFACFWHCASFKESIVGRVNCEVAWKPPDSFDDDSNSTPIYLLLLSLRC
jgi:hypothetical protein